MSRATVYIAVIDDDESFLRSLARLLRAAQYQPVTYASAELFMDDDKHPHFDCLLVDVRLGGISGIELQRRLASVGSRTPVIFVSAHDDPATRREAFSAGCAAFISKVEPSGAILDAIAAVVPPQDHRIN